MLQHFLQRHIPIYVASERRRACGKAGRNGKFDAHDGIAHILEAGRHLIESFAAQQRQFNGINTVSHLVEAVKEAIQPRQNHLWIV